MKILGRDAILKAFKVQTEDVETGAGTIRVSQIGPKGTVELWNRLGIIGDNVKNIDLDTHLIVLAVVDNAGQSVLTTEDVEAIQTGNNVLYVKLRGVARRLNGFDGEPAKNSELSSGVDSSSSSPEN